MRWLVVVAVAACSPEIDPPQLEAVEPPAAARGAHVRLTGHGMCGGAESCVQDGPRIEVGDARAAATNITTATDTVFLFDIPMTAATGPSYIVLTFDGRASNHLAFEVIP